MPLPSLTGKSDVNEVCSHHPKRCACNSQMIDECSQRLTKMSENCESFWLVQINLKLCTVHVVLPTIEWALGWSL